jgi:hypothetical protein
MVKFINSLHFVVDVEFSVNVSDVFFNGIDADEFFIGDFFCRAIPAIKFQYFFFSFCKFIIAFYFGELSSKWLRTFRAIEKLMGAPLL